MVPTPTLEKRGREQKGGEGRQERGGNLLSRMQEKRERRREGGEGVFNPNNSHPQKTKLPKDSIKH